MTPTEDHGKPTDTVSPDIRGCFEKLLADPQVRKGLEFIKNDEKRRIEEQIEITQIPAPPFEEASARIHGAFGHGETGSLAIDTQRQDRLASLA